MATTDCPQGGILDTVNIDELFVACTNRMDLQSLSCTADANGNVLSFGLTLTPMPTQPTAAETTEITPSKADGRPKKHLGLAGAAEASPPLHAFSDPE